MPGVGGGGRWRPGRRAPIGGSAGKRRPPRGTCPQPSLILSNSLFFPSAANLGGNTLKETTADSPAACCNACSDYDGCSGYNYCSGDTCEGGATKGACHLKAWETPLGFAEAWGCSGEQGQAWRSGFMSGMQRWAAYPPPCPAPGEPAPEIPGLPGASKTNWQGEIVILDVDSWKMGEGGNHGSPFVRSAYACATSCFTYRNKADVLPNAFTYCDDPAGCGTGCAAFSRGNAPWDGGPGAWWAAEQRYFGPFGGKGCSKTNPDAFGYQLCSCKVVDLGAPAKNAEPGWVSGPTVQEAPR